MLDKENNISKEEALKKFPFIEKLDSKECGLILVEITKMLLIQEKSFLEALGVLARA